MSKNIDPASILEGSYTATVGTDSTLLLPLNDDRRTIILQNLDTVPVYVYFGDGCAPDNFSFILPGGTDSADGTGGVFTEDVLSYTGIITACVAADTAIVQVASI